MDGKKHKNMNRYLIVLILSFFLLKGYSQNNTNKSTRVTLGPDFCYTTVYSLYGLLIDGKIMCDFFSKNSIKRHTKKIYLIDKSIINKYPYFNFKNYKSLHEEEIKSLIVLNNKLLYCNEKKSILHKYKKEDIIEFYFVKRFDAIKKFGWKYGKNGALIINTK